MKQQEREGQQYRRAIVIGSSIGGLIAARVLSDAFAEVVVIERDTLPVRDEPRRGVPQGRHAHGLLAAGREALESLFPGLTADLVMQGALTGDLQADCAWFNQGTYLARAPSELRGLLISRPALEGVIRRRVMRRPNVHVREACKVIGLTVGGQGSRIEGVRLDATGNGCESGILNADLVVDSGGRHSRIPQWLAELGYPGPVEDKIDVDLAYATRNFRRRPGHIGGLLAAVTADSGPQWRFGVAIAQEAESWIVTIGGYLGDAPPTDEAGYKAFARSLPGSEIADLVGRADPISPIQQFRFPASIRRRYEQLPRFPKGLLVFGDALASFNPRYGQGMSVAALEGLALAEDLTDGGDGLAQRFFAKAARIIETPWQIAVGNDLRNPAVIARRTPQTRFFNWYVGQLLEAAEHDPALSRAFLSVANLSAPPTSFLGPRIVARIVAARIAGRPLWPTAGVVATR